jgi:hypothetical protein
VRRRVVFGTSPKRRSLRRWDEKADPHTQYPVL